MRLLQRKDGGKYSLTEFVGDAIPRYAILSHTWGAYHEEVTLADLENDAGMDKAGYMKLHFCAHQAAKDGLHYFWVDTCCIDKSSSAELTEAINSMFAWYRDAARCYVYLSDVSTSSPTNSTPAQQHWNRAFQQSRWFTRGWTLQELVAPVSVEFFSAKGERLGNKNSLVQELHNITGISVEALQGSPLDQLSVNERMPWVGQRMTKLEEDAAYSLLGIFDVHMPLLYGEGRRNAFAQLQKEIVATSNEKCSTLPQNDTSQSHGHTTHAYYRPVFDGPISGRYVIPGTRFTGGKVNFDFGEGWEKGKDEEAGTMNRQRDDPNDCGSLEKPLDIVVPLQRKITIKDTMFSLSLPLLVDKILRHLPLPALEPTVSAGKCRVYWTPGGKHMFDDYVELDSGAAVGLEKALQKRYKLSKQARTGGQAVSGLIQRILNGFLQQDEGQQQP